MAGGNDLSDNRYLFAVFEIFKVVVFAALPSVVCILRSNGNNILTC